MYSLGRERVIEALRERGTRMSAALDADETELARSAPENPIFVSEHRYQLARRRAERDWVTGFVRELDEGAISWPQ
jgi:hypothetical protein